MNESGVAGFITDHPEIVALVVLILGAVLARLASAGVAHALESFVTHTSRYTTTDQELVSPTYLALSRGFTFWIILLASLALSLHLLGIDGISSVLEAMLRFLPKFIIGVAIIGAGYLLGLLLRELVARLDDDPDLDALPPRLVHGAVVLVAVVMGLQHMGVDISFVARLLLVVVTVLLGGMALAFALGARQHAANLIAQAEMQRYSVGESIRIAGKEGTIVSMHRTGLDLATREGVVAIPAALFSSEVVVRLADPADHD